MAIEAKFVLCRFQWFPPALFANPCIRLAVEIETFPINHAIGILRAIGTFHESPFLALNPAGVANVFERTESVLLTVAAYISHHVLAVNSNTPVDVIAVELLSALRTDEVLAELMHCLP